MPGIAWSCHKLRRGEEGFFPGACRGSTALPTPGLQTSGLQNWENRFLPFVETCYGRPGKLIQLCSLKPFHHSLPAIRNISFCPPRPATLSPQPTYPASFPLPILQPNTMPLCPYRPRVPFLPAFCSSSALRSKTPIYRKRGEGPGTPRDSPRALWLVGFMAPLYSAQLLAWEATWVGLTLFRTWDRESSMPPIPQP